MKAWFHRLTSPKHFFEMTTGWSRSMSIVCSIFFAWGIYGAFFLAPPDYQQGDAFRMLYVHVPSAFMSLGVYTALATAAVVSLVWRVKLADYVIEAALPIGAWFTALALMTGAIWGKPMWGTWWIWDARLTSELILLFIYLAAITLSKALIHHSERDKIVAVFIVVGFVDIPIVHYSVIWWQTLHQGPSLSALRMPTIDTHMLYPLLVMILAFATYFLALGLYRVRMTLLWRERHTRWVKEFVENE